MSESLYAVAVLACPLGMGAMMWLMMRGGRHSPVSDAAERQAEISALRAELDQLQAEQREASRSTARPDAL